MVRFLVRRLLLAGLALLGATSFVFAAVLVLPGSPRALTGDQPLLLQYLTFLGGLLQGDLGTDAGGQAVSGMVARRLPVTATLVLLALLLEGLLALAVGAVAAAWRRPALRGIRLLTATLVVAVPVLVAGLLVHLTVGLPLGAPADGPVDAAVRWVLPAVLLAALALAAGPLLAVGSGTWLPAVPQHGDRVQAARAKGLSSASVVRRHLLRADLVPVLTFLGAHLGALLAAAVVLEGLFDLPGLGQAVLEAVRAQEGAVLAGVATVLVAVYLAGTLLVDAVCAALDPRLRHA